MLSRDAVRSRMEADGEGISFTECAALPSALLRLALPLVVPLTIPEVIIIMAND